MSAQPSNNLGQGATESLDLTDRARELLQPLVHLVLDVDGTLALDDNLFPTTNQFIEILHDLGMSFTIITNNSSKSRPAHCHRLRRMGLEISDDQILVSTQATLRYLKESHPQVKRLFVLGTPGLQEEFSDAGYTICDHRVEDEPDAVIVGFDMSLTYERLCRAAYWIKNGKKYFATHPDYVCPTDQPTVLVDCGSIINCLKAAAGREPDAILGKPNPQMLEVIRQKHGLGKSQIAMVGDRLYTDMAMAHAAEVASILVLCGETTRDQAESVQPSPDIVVSDPGELGNLLVLAKRTE